MGNFAGHALPGGFFILFSLWHAMQTINRYFRSKSTNGKYPFKASSYYACESCGGWPLESMLKLGSCTVGILGETITGLDSSLHFIHIGNAQHITMFFFFGVQGLVEILHFYNFHLPPKMCYVAGIMAFTIENILFYWHLMGRNALNAQVHILLVYTGVAVCVCLLIEMFNRTLVLPILCRIYLVLLHGLWFYAIAFVLHGHEVGLEDWDASHVHMMLASVVFGASAGIALVVIMAIWFGVACRYSELRHSGHSKHDYKRLDLNFVDMKGAADQSISLLQADDAELSV